MCRDKAKRKGKGTSSGALDFSMNLDEMRKITSFDRYNLNFAERLTFDKEKEAKKKERTEREELEDMKFLMENTDHLLRPALELMMSS